MRRRLLVLGASIALLVQGAVSAAHPGGLDAYGCHHNRRAGGYHCHRGPLAAQGFASKAEMLKALKGTQSKGTASNTTQHPGELTHTQEPVKRRAK